MILELTPDEASLLTGILTVWVAHINEPKYEIMLIHSILEKIFAEDKIAVDEALGKIPSPPSSPENASKVFSRKDTEERW